MPKAKASTIHQLEEAYATEFMAHYDRMISAGYPQAVDLPMFMVNVHNRLTKGIYPRGKAYDRIAAREYPLVALEEGGRIETAAREAILAQDA